MTKTLRAQLSLCFAFTALCVLPLTGCTEKSDTAGTSNAALQKALNAFDDVCLKTAPTFAKAETAAKKYGITDYLPLGTAKISMSKANGMNVQIKPSIECAVGNDTVGGKEVLPAFINMISTKTGASLNPMPTTTPFMASLHGRTYIFHLDRDGGDTFVMMDRDGFKQSQQKR